MTFLEIGYIHTGNTYIPLFSFCGHTGYIFDTRHATLIRISMTSVLNKFLDTYISSVNSHVVYIDERALRNTIGALGGNGARMVISSGVNKSNNSQITSPTEGVSEFMDLHGYARQIREPIHLSASSTLDVATSSLVMKAGQEGPMSHTSHTKDARRDQLYCS